MSNNTVRFGLMTARDTSRRVIRQVEMAIAVIEYQETVRSTHAERNTLNKYIEYLLRDVIDGQSKILTSSASIIDTLGPIMPPTREELPF
jgi:hypothetical protein